MSTDAAILASVAAHPDGTVLSFSVRPRSSYNTIDVATDGGLRVRLTAPPVDGAANAMLLKVLAEALHLPRGRLRIVSGATSRNKRVLVIGHSAQDVQDRLVAVVRRI